MPWMICFGFACLLSITLRRTMHRMSCFRDDIIFVVYLYQRHIYPEDKTRMFDEDDDSTVPARRAPASDFIETTSNPAAAAAAAAAAGSSAEPKKLK